MISLLLKSDVLTKLGEQASQLGKSGEVAKIGAVGAANLTRDHLGALNNERPNHLGGKRTNFYAAAARSVTEPEISGPSASFTITQIGLAQRWLGGTIRAGEGTSSSSGGPTKFLSLPARAEAYGKTPGEFNDLEFVPLGRDRGMLVEALQTPISFGRKKKDGSRTLKHGDTRGGLVMFWLVKEVEQQPDPTVMPTEQELSTAASDAMEEHISDWLML